MKPVSYLKELLKRWAGRIKGDWKRQRGRFVAYLHDLEIAITPFTLYNIIFFPSKTAKYPLITDS